MGLSSGMMGMPREEPRRDILVVVVGVKVEGWLKGTIEEIER